MNRMIQADMSEASASYTSNLDWTYNTLSLKETETQVIDGYNSGNGRTITYAWDVEGQKTGVTYPVSGSTLAYTRDALDRVDVISRGGTQVIDYTFNGRRPIKKAYPGSHSLLTYDGYGRVTQIHHKDTSSGNSLAKFVYGYDKSHQVTSQDKYFYDNSNNRITTDTVDKGDQYDYDGAKRLVTVLRGVPTAYIGDTIASNISNTRYDDLVEYVLDQTGNRLTRKIDGSNERTYAYNPVNEMTSEGGTSKTYYDNGTFKGSGAATDYKYIWDDHFAWYDAGARQFTWHYDALGRQIARTKSGSGGASDIHIYYDGQDDIEVCSWISSTETQLRRMVYGERINELLEHTDYAGPTSYYAHGDKLDSVMLLVLADGTIKESYRYTDYGQPTVVDDTFAKLTTLNSNIGNWKRYTGQEHALPASVSDPWQFYRARAYRADAGRFVQPDRKVYVDGSNRYAYARNGPIRFTDPLGALSLSEDHECSGWLFMEDLSPQMQAYYYCGCMQQNCVGHAGSCKHECIVNTMLGHLDDYEPPEDLNPEFTHQGWHSGSPGIDLLLALAEGVHAAGQGLDTVASFVSALVHTFPECESAEDNYLSSCDEAYEACKTNIEAGGWPNWDEPVCDYPSKPREP